MARGTGVYLSPMLTTLATITLTGDLPLRRTTTSKLVHRRLEYIIPRAYAIGWVIMSFKTANRKGRYRCFHLVEASLQRAKSSKTLNMPS